MKENIKRVAIFWLNIFCDYSWSDIEKHPKKLNKRIKRYAFVIKLFPLIKFEWFWKRNIAEIETKGFEDFNRLFDLVDDYSKFIISKLLYFSKQLDNQNCKKVLDFAKKTKIPEFRYWITQDISRFTFHLQNGFYPEYYSDRRGLLNQICLDTQLRIPEKREETGSKLCIITSMLDKSIMNSTQRVATMISKALLSEFQEICIFPLDTFATIGGEGNTLSTVLPYRPSIESKKEIAEQLPDCVQVHYPKGSNYKEKAQDTLNAIYAYNPCAILDMSDEYSAISYYYSQDFYTVYLPLRDTNSSSFFTYIVGAPKWKFAESNQKFNSIDKNAVKEWNFPEYVPYKTNIHNRENLSIPEDAFVMISIGNNATTFTKEFVDEMCSMIAIHNFVWLLVGQKAPEYMKNTYKHLFDNHLIIEHGYEQELYSICSVCDIHVRPNMTGGSGATAIAAMAGLPIAMTNFSCDPSRWLGIDFHPGISTYQDLTKYIIELSHNEDYYNSEKNIVLSLINDAVDTPDKWKQLAQILKGGDECGE